MEDLSNAQLAEKIKGWVNTILRDQKEKHEEVLERIKNVQDDLTETHNLLNSRLLEVLKKLDS